MFLYPFTRHLRMLLDLLRLFLLEAGSPCFHSVSICGRFLSPGQPCYHPSFVPLLPNEPHASVSTAAL